MAGHDIVVIGGSTGSIEALRQMVGDLPADLAAAIFVVVHLQPDAPSHLPAILSRAGPLPAVHARDGQRIKTGRIYVAPPDRHLLVEPGRARLTRGPRENRFRPAVDPLFRSAAEAYGPRVIGLILSGALGDGTAGLLEVKRRGGLAIVQDPADALAASMPQNALENVPIDVCAPVADLADRLVGLVETWTSEEPEFDVSDQARKEIEAAALEPGPLHEVEHPGTLAGYGCPECGGTLWELSDSGLLRFRCRVGHAYSAHSLFQEQLDSIEEALWVALRSLEERESLAGRLRDHATQRGWSAAAAKFSAQIEEMHRRADTIRRALAHDLTDLAAPSA